MFLLVSIILSRVSVQGNFLIELWQSNKETMNCGGLVRSSGSPQQRETESGFTEVNCMGPGGERPVDGGQ